MRINQFNRCRIFLKTLGGLEKQPVLAERDFHKTLQLWNKPQNPPPPPTAETDTSTTDTTSNHWILKYTNLTKDEFKTMILMGERKTRYQLGFFHS